VIELWGSVDFRAGSRGIFVGSGEGLPAGEGLPRDPSSESESSSSGDLGPLAKSIESTVSWAALGALS
jgi:hypothetical protein